MVTREAINGIDSTSARGYAVEKLRGGIPMHRPNFVADIFSEGDFLRNQQPLTEIVVGFAQKELGWSEAVARRIYEKALRVEDPEEESTIPSVMLFRKEGAVVGVSAQRLKYIRTYQDGVIPVFYHILRAIEPEHRSGGIGKESVELGRLIHRKAKFYSARNGGPVPAWTTMQVSKDILVPGTFHPWDRFYDNDYEKDCVYQEIMVQLHMDIRTNGRWINGSTGVSIADYPEYNKSYMPNPNHEPTMALLRRMEGRKIKEGELGMVIKRGDSVIVVAKIQE